jgi:flagellar P-ring protein precursor FlgI
MVAKIFDDVWTVGMRYWIGVLLLAATLVAQAADGLRLKDMGKFAGWRSNVLTGMGLVVGVAGTGDCVRSKATRQSITNMLARYDLAISADDIQSRNVAIVTVSAVLPPFARPGDNMDISVSSLGDARSLVGGTLVLAPLLGPDQKVYALAQGPLSVGGYKYDMNGNVIQKNHPTMASVPNGATIETGVLSDVRGENGNVTFVLSEPDYTTASHLAHAINQRFGAELAIARDASGIEIIVPRERQARLADFLTVIENVTVEPDRRARVVVNERTGTVVSGGDVRISSVVVSHGDLKLSIVTEQSVSQPVVIGSAGPNIRSLGVTNTRVAVNESGETGMVASSTTVADLVQQLVKMKTNTRDIISILRAVKAAGALHAELVVQ